MSVKGPLNAEDLVEALREAHRVAKPGAPPRHERIRTSRERRLRALFELLAEALPAFALKEDDGPPLRRFLEDASLAADRAGVTGFARM